MWGPWMAATTTLSPERTERDLGFFRFFVKERPEGTTFSLSTDIRDLPSAYPHVPWPSRSRCTFVARIPYHTHPHQLDSVPTFFLSGAHRLNFISSTIPFGRGRLTVLFFATTGSRSPCHVRLKEGCLWSKLPSGSISTGQRPGSCQLLCLDRIVVAHTAHKENMVADFELVEGAVRTVVIQHRQGLGCNRPENIAWGRTVTAVVIEQHFLAGQNGSYGNGVTRTVPLGPSVALSMSIRRSSEPPWLQ